MSQVTPEVSQSNTLGLLETYIYCFCIKNSNEIFALEKLLDTVYYFKFKYNLVLKVHRQFPKRTFHHQ